MGVVMFFGASGGSEATEVLGFRLPSYGLYAERAVSMQACFAELLENVFEFWAIGSGGEGSGVVCGLRF